MFEVFFSVLVLHWITSKDNASTTSTSENANFPPNQLPSSPKRLVPRPPLSQINDYELGLRDWQQVAGGVVTVVSAKEPDDESTLDRISTIPPNVVTVVKEVELVNTGRSSISPVGDEETGKTESTDDLCYKQRL